MLYAKGRTFTFIVLGPVPISRKGILFFLCIILKKIVNLNVLNMSLKTFGLEFGLLKNILDKVLDSDIDKSLGLGLGLGVTKGDSVHL